MARVKEAIELHRQRIPRRLLWIDALGAVLVAIGVLELLSSWPRLLPEALRSPATGLARVVAGSLIMLAVPVWLLRRRESRNAHKENS